MIQEIRPNDDKSLFPKSPWSRLFIFIAIIQAVAVIPLEIMIMINRFRTAEELSGDLGGGRPVIVYNSLFIMALLFFIALCWDAVLRKNTIQAICATLFNYATSMYTVVQYIDNDNRPDDFIRRLELIVMAIIFFCSLIDSYVTWKLFLEFGWKIFKKLGADLSIRRMFLAHQVLVTLLKLLLFFFVCYTIQLTALVLRTDDYETWVQIAFVIPGSVVILFLAFYGLRNEHSSVMRFVISILVITTFYLIYKFIRMTMYLGKTYDPFRITRQYLTYFISITFILVILVLINSIICYRNFGKGLKESIIRYKERKHSMKLRSTRLEIDGEVGIPNQRWQIE